MKIRITKDQEYLYRQLKAVPRDKLPASPDAMFQAFIELGQALLLVLGTPERRDEFLAKFTMSDPTMELARFWSSVHAAGLEAPRR